MGKKIGGVGAAILAASVSGEPADATSSARIEVEQAARRLLEDPPAAKAEWRPLGFRTPKFIRGPADDSPPPPPPPSMKQ